MELYARLCAIADTEGVSGFEDLTAEEVVRQLTPLTDDVYTDALGNVIGYKKGKESEKTIHKNGKTLRMTNISTDNYLVLFKYLQKFIPSEKRINAGTRAAVAIPPKH